MLSATQRQLDSALGGNRCLNLAHLDPFWPLRSPPTTRRKMEVVQPAGLSPGSLGLTLTEPPFKTDPSVPETHSSQAYRKQHTNAAYVDKKHFNFYQINLYKSVTWSERSETQQVRQRKFKLDTKK